MQKILIFVGILPVALIRFLRRPLRITSTLFKSHNGSLRCSLHTYVVNELQSCTVSIRQFFARINISNKVDRTAGRSQTTLLLLLYEMPLKISHSTCSLCYWWHFQVGVPAVNGDPESLRRTAIYVGHAVPFIHPTRSISYETFSNNIMFDGNCICIRVNWKIH